MSENNLLLDGSKDTIAFNNSPVESILEITENAFIVKGVRYEGSTQEEMNIIYEAVLRWAKTA